MPVCEMDVRPGGCYRYVMRDPNGREIVMRGEYREVAPPERLVSTEYFEGFSEPGWRPEDATVGTATFEERDGQTTWTLTVLYPSRDVRDAALALEPAWDGMDESFDRLIEVVRTLTA
jgi:uncharacterized protein YndB with AHSA1/START domain